MNYFSISQIISIFVDPFSVFDLLMNLCVHHNRAQIPFVAQLITAKLYHLSTYRQNEKRSQRIVVFTYCSPISRLIENSDLLMISILIEILFVSFCSTLSSKHSNNIKSFINLILILFFSSN